MSEPITALGIAIAVIFLLLTVVGVLIQRALKGVDDSLGALNARTEAALEKMGGHGEAIAGLLVVTNEHNRRLTVLEDQRRLRASNDKA